MKTKLQPRDIAVLGLGALTAVAIIYLLVTTFGEWREYSADCEALAAQGAEGEDADSLRTQVAAVGNRIVTCRGLTAQADDELAALEAGLTPLDDESMRGINCDIFDLAEWSKITIEEAAPITKQELEALTKARTEDDAYYRRTKTRATAPKSPLDAFPTGDKYRRPLLSIKCKGPYANIRKFVIGLNSLTWAVVPLRFEIVSISTGRSTGDNEETDTLYRREDEGLLRLTIILAK